MGEGKNKCLATVMVAWYGSRGMTENLRQMLMLSKEKSTGLGDIGGGVSEE